VKHPRLVLVPALVVALGLVSSVSLPLISPVRARTADGVVGRAISSEPQGVKAKKATKPKKLVIAAAGNIACDPKHPSFNSGRGTKTACRMKRVSGLLLDRNGRPRYKTVLALGDNQYVCGGLRAYRRSYGKSWGRVYRVTKPVVGDKDYRTTRNAPHGTDCTDPPGRAAGFFQYFDGIEKVKPGATPGAGAYYSFNVPAGCGPADKVCWHVIALNGNCNKGGGCEPGTPQFNWLEDDLAAHGSSDYACTLAFWHWPRFSSGKHGSNADFDSIWQLLYDHHVDVVLNAHEHLYERFAPQNPRGKRDGARGIRQFTVGTGGASHVKFPSARRLPTSQASNDATFGILRLKIRADAYTWRFVPEPGKRFSDASSAPTACH
jgi:acid phosphatase type 7